MRAPLPFHLLPRSKRKVLARFSLSVLLAVAFSLPAAVADADSEYDCKQDAPPAALQVSLTILNPPNSLGDIVIHDEHVEVKFVVTDPPPSVSSKKDQIRLIDVATGKVLKAKKRGERMLGTLSLDADVDVTGEFRVEYLHKCSGQVIPTVSRTVTILPEADDSCGGVTCPAGPAGSEGPMGPQGPPGADGAQGLPGTNGTDGAAGQPGLPGLNCWDLDANLLCHDTEDRNSDGQCDASDCQITGPSGADGRPGPPGTNGTDGAVGLTGATGARGPAGPQGPPGSASAASLGCAGRNLLVSGKGSSAARSPAPVLNAMLASNSPGAARVAGGNPADQYNGYASFNVDLLANQTGGEAHTWTTARGGGVCFNLSDDPGTAPKARPEWEDIVLQGPMPTLPSAAAVATANSAATPSATAVATGTPTISTYHFTTYPFQDVVRISPIQVYFPAVAVASSPNLQYRQFAPLPPVYPNIVFEFVSHADTHPDIRSWVQSYYDGSPQVKDIAIEILNVTASTTTATYDLVNCAPVAYEEISLGLLGGTGGVRRYTLEVKCGEIIIDLPDNTLDGWIKDMQSGTNSLRDISMTVLDSNGDINDSYEFLESFLTGYSLSPLSTAESDVPVVETIEIVPGYSDDLLQ